MSQLTDPALHKTTTWRTGKTKINRRGSHVRLSDSTARCSCGWLAYADNLPLARSEAREHRELMALIDWSKRRKLDVDEAHNEVWLGWTFPPRPPFYTAHCRCGTVAGSDNELRARHALYQHIETANGAIGAWWCDGFKEWRRGKPPRACRSHDHTRTSPEPYWHMKILP